MIITENVTINGRQFVKNYSNAGMYIRQEQTGAVYSEAIDIENSAFTYVETDIPIEGEELSETEQKAAAFDYITGRSDGNE